MTMKLVMMFISEMVVACLWTLSQWSHLLAPLGMISSLAIPSEKYKWLWNEQKFSKLFYEGWYIYLQFTFESSFTTKPRLTYATIKVDFTKIKLQIILKSQKYHWWQIIVTVTSSSASSTRIVIVPSVQVGSSVLELFFF